MKKRGILLIGLIFFLNFVSASYECSTGVMTSDQDEIKLNGRTSINGVGIGLIDADEVPAIERYYAKMIIDAFRFELTDAENSTEADMKEGIKTIALIRLADGNANISVDGNSGIIAKGEVMIIDSSQIYLYETDGVYPNGTATTKGIIGKSVLETDNKNSTQIIVINEISYVLELLSASESNALISVKKCKDSNASVIIIDDEPVEISSANSSINNSEINFSAQDAQEPPIVNFSSNETFEQIAGDETGEVSQSKSELYEWKFITLVVFLVLVLGGVVVLLVRNLRENIGKISEGD